MVELAKFTKANIKEVWESEINFSNWLAEDGLRILNKHLGMRLMAAKREVRMRGFRADLVCVNTDRREYGYHTYTVIENQRGNSNHDHLGKLMTYAALINAKVVIWIVENLRNEHHTALNFLNKLTDNKFRFICVKLIVKRISDARYSVYFQSVL